MVLRRDTGSRTYRGGYRARERYRPAPAASDLFLSAPAQEKSIAEAVPEKLSSSEVAAALPEPVTTEVHRRGRPKGKTNVPEDALFRATEQMDERIRRLPTEEKLRLMPAFDYLKKHGVIDLATLKRLHSRRWARQNLDRLIEMGILAPVTAQEAEAVLKTAPHLQETKPVAESAPRVEPKTRAKRPRVTEQLTMDALWG